MPAPLARRWALLVLPALLLVAALAGPASAADDSNSGQLTQVPTVSPSQLNSALSTLLAGNNDTQLQQLVSQFQSQMSAGDYSGAQSTLSQLQALSSSGESGASPSLNALLQSLSVGSQGASVDPNTLASLLTAGSATATTPGSQERLSLDMQSLAGLMQYANSTLASELLQNSSLLSQSAFGGQFSSPVSLPSVSGIPGLGVPSMGAPSLSVGTPSGGLPSIPIADFLAPVLLVAVVGALVFYRGRLVRMIGSQSLPGLPLLRQARDEGEVAVPSDPRKRIEFYFGRAVRLMARRGVPKLENETHREFAVKCEGTPERPHVAAISSLYEKAKFSGQEVGSPDADLAASELRAMGVER